MATEEQSKKMDNKAPDETGQQGNSAGKIFLAIFLFLVCAGTAFLITQNFIKPSRKEFADVASRQTTDADFYYELDYKNGELFQSYTGWILPGTLYNNKGTNLTYVSIVAGVYDGNVKIGSCSDNVNNLAKDGQWRFKLYCYNAVGKSIRVEDIISW